MMARDGCTHAPRSTRCAFIDARVGVGGGLIRMLHLLAYIDPGSGSLIIQAVIATAVAIPFFFRQQIARVTRSLRGDRTSPPPTKPTDHAA
jgi:hypothetical protein